MGLPGVCSVVQVIVMSATMDVDLFSQYFNGAPVLYLEGRQHPIQVYYTKQPQQDYLHAALVSVFQIHQVCVLGRALASSEPQRQEEYGVAWSRVCFSYT